MAEVIPTVLLDSVIMIDHFNGIRTATDYFLDMQGMLAISVITRAEGQNRWKMPDALQAALAKHHKLKLATRDTDDFPPRRYRFVIVPYTV